MLPGYPAWLSGADVHSLAILFLCGFVWGVTALFFDKAILRVGLAVTYGIGFGIFSSFGSLLALPFTKTALAPRQLFCMLTGTALVVLGIVLITKAGQCNEQSHCAPKGASRWGASCRAVGLWKRRYEHWLFLRRAPCGGCAQPWGGRFRLF